MILSSTPAWLAAAQHRAGSLAPVLRRWQGLPVLVRDAIITAAGATLVFAPALAPVSVVIGELEPRPLDAFGLFVAAALWLPLVLRRRRPVLTLALVGGAFAAHELGGYPPVMATIGFYLALYSVGAHQQRHRRWLLAGATVAYAVFAVALSQAGSPQGVADFLAFFLVMPACWGAGAWVRARQMSEEQRRRLSVAAAMADERSRIARELHDVVTHHVTAMVIQADAAQFVAGEQNPALGTGLSAISDTGRRALGDLRHLLGVLNATGEPENPAKASKGGSRPKAGAQNGTQAGAVAVGAGRSPIVGSMRELVENIRSTGQPVELSEEGEQPDHGGGAQLVAYRVLQEALTNAMKHATGQPTTVRLRHTRTGTEIEVRTRTPVGERPAGYRPSPVGGGHGLDGMRQRVDIFGGRFEAGPTPEGEFRLWATIPGDEPT